MATNSHTFVSCHLAVTDLLLSVTAGSGVALHNGGEGGVTHPDTCSHAVSAVQDCLRHGLLPVRKSASSVTERSSSGLCVGKSGGAA